MKNMRKFYESRIVLDSNSAVTTAELLESKSALISAELQNGDYQIDRY